MKTDFSASFAPSRFEPGRASADLEPFVFPCQGEALVGVLHRPALPAARGVVIVVGGPQYRVGSHRQFLLLARDLAEAGIASLRFDHRGMGDSTGAFVGFEGCGPDIRAAVDVLCERVPEVREVVLWGLCDAASAVCAYAHKDPRVTGVVLLNPWVRTESGEAKARLKHYYTGRVLSRGFWNKVLQGKFDLRASLKGLAEVAGRALQRRGTATSSDLPLPERMAAALAGFHGKTLLVLSGKDLTAAEFRDVCAASPAWQQILEGGNVERRELPEANHTFSRREWRDRVSEWTREWVVGW